MKGLLLLLALLMPAVAVAAPNPDFVELKDGAPIVLKPGRAYILFRSVRAKGVLVADPVFYREPDAIALEAYHVARRAAFEKARAKRPELVLENFSFDYDGPPNLMRTHGGNRYAQGVNEDAYVVEVKPGSYVIAGLSDKALVITETCMCMGTVRFQARAGVITDLGHLLTDRVDQPSTIPELREVSGRGARINGMLLLLVATIRPDAKSAWVPAPLRGLARVPADFRAMGKFPNRFASNTNRMAAIPGVLEYDEDRVIDVKAGSR